MNEVERRFAERGIQRGGPLFVSRETAPGMVEACEAAGLRLLGVDGFFLGPNTTQPSLEHSRTFSIQEDAYEAARAFLRNQTDSLWFEVVCE